MSGGLRAVEAIREVNDALDESLAPALRAAGLSSSHFSLLHLLADRGAMRASELAAYQRCVRSNVTRLVASLEERGLVERVADATDGRARLVRLTESGRSAYEGVAVVARELQGRLLAGLGQGRLAELERLATLGARLVDGSEAEASAATDPGHHLDLDEGVRGRQ